MSTPAVPTYDDITRAAALIEPHVRRTPTMQVDVHGHRVTLKLELMQHGGSFKVRGAFTSVLGRNPRPGTLVAASGGNHGLAVAYVGHALRIETRIFVPRSAPDVKVRAIGALGADVVQVGDNYAEALVASREASERPGVLALHAYDAIATVTGQGTLGPEIAEEVPDVDTVLVAVGGGGLLAGVTCGLSGARPSARVTAVEPETCPTLDRAVAHGGPVDVSVGGVAVDALGASRLGAIAWAVASEHRTSSLLVGDDAIMEARQWLWSRTRVAAEPAGAAAFAALLSGAYVPRATEQVCVVVCGGNADPSTLS